MAPRRGTFGGRGMKTRSRIGVVSREGGHKYTGARQISGGQNKVMAVKFIDNTGRITRDARTAINRTRRLAMEDFRKTVRVNIKGVGAYDTGDLYRSVKVDGVRFIVHVGQDLPRPYHVYVEMGTSRMPARPYFEPAVTQMAELWPKMLAEAMKKAGL